MCSHQTSSQVPSNNYQPPSDPTLESREKQFEAFLNDNCEFDSGHDLLHIKRVVHNTKLIGSTESVNPMITIPAAWLHDCVVVPKDSDQRSFASRKAAARATTFLEEVNYPANLRPAIAHAIEAHSFSAQITPETLEAKVVQDADRLDALGAIGIARCFLVGASFNRPVYDSTDPFCKTRKPDDSQSIIDHFYTKLLKLPDTMQTQSGQKEASRRAEMMRAFLDELRRNISENTPRQ